MQLAADADQVVAKSVASCQRNYDDKYDHSLADCPRPSQLEFRRRAKRATSSFDFISRVSIVR